MDPSDPIQLSNQAEDMIINSTQKETTIPNQISELGYSSTNQENGVILNDENQSNNSILEIKSNLEPSSLECPPNVCLRDIGCKSRSYIASVIGKKALTKSGLTSSIRIEEDNSIPSKTSKNKRIKVIEDDEDEIEAIKIAENFVHKLTFDPLMQGNIYKDNIRKIVGFYDCKGHPTTNIDDCEVIELEFEQPANGAKPINCLMNIDRGFKFSKEFPF